jgi:inositol oxygenase
LDSDNKQLQKKKTTEKMRIIDTVSNSEFDEICEDWENDLLDRYPDNGSLPKSKHKDQFRVYTEENKRVANFYAQNHEFQTFDFVMAQKKKYNSLDKMEMGIWEGKRVAESAVQTSAHYYFMNALAMEYLNQLVDESDPDTSLSQIHHLLQSAEALRRDKKPEWMILVGLIHDLGKILTFFGEPQVRITCPSNIKSKTSNTIFFQVGSW